ncbi:MAG: HAMP domain-containing protein [Defluviitaleaceae bacterium]|nr:HAMP domain-containing protein [Defluviitaleaceae bacterium]
MKTTLGKKILLMFFVPFLIIFGVLSVLIYTTISQYVNDWVQLEMRGLTEINATDLAGQIDSVRIAVLSAAVVLEEVDGTGDDDRGRVSRLVRSLFTNDVVYNAWIIYEPQAFDGRDDEFRYGYPGSPSGRFMLSYVMEDGEIVVAPDMHEEWLHIMEYAYWYIRPRDEARLFMDIDNEFANVWDYGLDDDPLYTLTIAAPVLRDGLVIGVVGADVAVDTMTIAIDSEHHASHVSNVAVFYSTGRIFYSPDLEFAEESVDTLGFENTGLIRETFYNREPLMLPDEHCVFADTRSFVFFQPVYVRGYHESLFLYVSTPRTVLYESLLPVSLIIMAIGITVLAVLMILLIFVIRRVSMPLKRLTVAAQAIAQGNIEVAIDYSTDPESEIGQLSQSLHTMVEQFRVNALKMEQQQRETAIKAQIEALLTASGGAQEIFGSVAEMLREYFGITKVTIVYINAGNAIAFPGKVPSYTFLEHEQVDALLTDRRVCSLNSQAISSHKLNFLSPNTRTACFAPLRSESLLGYIIFEHNVPSGLSEGSEWIVMYISEILGEWLSQKEWDETVLPGGEPKESEQGPVQEAGEEPEHARPTNEFDNKPDDPDTPPVISKLKRIDGLAVDFALTRMGGLYEAYEKTVRLMARLLPDAITKMDKYLAEENMRDFTIEVHGIKGVLLSIGAVKIGGDAADIETAALKKDTAFRDEHYPLLKESLTALLALLNTALEADSSVEKEKIDKDRLSAALAEAKTAAEEYNAMQALDTLAPLADFSYNEEADGLLEKVIFALEEFDCKGALTNIIKMEEIL